MDSIACEDYSEESLSINQTYSLIHQLSSMRDRVATEGMSRDDAKALNVMVPGAIDELMVNKFTLNPSFTKHTVAVEALDFKRATLITAAVAAIIALITKIIGWLVSSTDTVANRAGSVMEIDTMNREFEKQVRENYDKELITEDVLRNKSTDVLKKVVRNKDINSYYVNDLIKRNDNGQILDHRGRQLRPTDISNAANKYISMLKRLRVSDKDHQMQAILGNMLIRKDGALPLVLEHLDWSGSSIRSKAKVNTAYASAIRPLLDHAGFILDRVNVAAVQLMRGPYNYGDNNEDWVDAGPGVLNGPNAYEAMLDLNDQLVNFTNGLESDFRLSAMFSPHEGDILVGGAGNFATIGVVRPVFRPEISELFDSINKTKDTYISFWDASSYQGHESVTGADHHEAYIKALATDKGRTELSDFFRTVFVKDGRATVSKYKVSLDYISKQNSEVNTRVLELLGHADTPGFEWVNLKFRRAAINEEGFSSDGKLQTSLVPSMLLTNALKTVSEITKTIAKLTTVLNVLANTTNRTIDMLSKAK